MITASSHAGTKAKFLLTPTTPTTLQITNDATATVQYRVLNQTNITRTLTIKPLRDVSQITSGTGVCDNPFTLAPQASCLLTLKINPSLLPNNIIEGPVVCKTQSATDTTPDPFLCSQPPTANQLNISRTLATVGRIQANPASLTLTAGSPHTPGTITITNLSHVLTVNNVRANFTGTALEGYITQDASDCTSISPLGSCTLTFMPQNTAVVATSFPIQGDNTEIIGASISITAPATTTIMAVNSPLVINTNSSAALTIKNTGTTYNADNITATLPSTLTNAGVTVTPCSPTSVAPGGTCTLTLTTSSTTLPNTGILLKGTNTAVAQASVSINGESTLSLTGSPLTLTANYQSGTMTITNTGSAAVSSVSANFTNTALNGAVSASSCASIAPNGGTCTMTFTSNNTVVNSVTSFPISSQTTSTSYQTITGELNIIPVPMMLISNGYPGNTAPPEILVCLIDTTSGNPTSCQNAGVSTSLLSTPQGMGLNAEQTTLYIANNTQIGSAYGITQCTVTSGTGLLSGCFFTSDPTFNIITSVTINTAGTFLYVTNSSDTVSVCPLIDGSFSSGSCTAYSDLNGGFHTPSASLLNETYNLSYISNKYNSSVSNGQLSTCSTISGISSCTSILVNSPSVSGVEPIALAMNSAVTMLYTPDFNLGGFYACPISQTTGQLSTCTNQLEGIGAIARVTGLALNQANTYFYLTGDMYGTNVGSSNKGFIQCPSVNDVFNVTGCVNNFSSLIPVPQYGIVLLND